MNLILQTIVEVLREQSPDVIYTVSKGHVNHSLVKQVISRANVYNTHLNVQRIRQLLIGSAKDILNELKNQ